MSTKFVYPVIDLTATGAHLKELLEERGITVQDVQEAMGFASKQAVYAKCCKCLVRAISRGICSFTAPADCFLHLQRWGTVCTLS